MDVGTPMSLRSEAGEVVFNQLDGSGASIGGGTVLAPSGLPDGNGYHITFIGGMDGAPIRNPVTNRPHQHGAIVHRFRKAAKIIYVEGSIIASAPQYRTTLNDALRDVLDGMMQAGVFGQQSAEIGRFFWTPAGQTTRFHSCVVYEPLTIEPGSPGSAAPKTFAFSLYSEHPEALSFPQLTTTINSGSSAVVANAGNTETWPVAKVYAPTTSGFVLSNGTYRLRWGQGRDPDPVAIRGDYIEIDMHRQTMYWDGDQGNALKFLHMRDSDFWSIPAGGKTVSLTGASRVEILSNAAWV